MINLFDLDIISLNDLTEDALNRIKRRRGLTISLDIIFYSTYFNLTKEAYQLIMDIAKDTIINIRQQETNDVTPLVHFVEEALSIRDKYYNKILPLMLVLVFFYFVSIGLLTWLFGKLHFCCPLLLAIIAIIFINWIDGFLLWTFFGYWKRDFEDYIIAIVGEIIKQGYIVAETNEDKKRIIKEFLRYLPEYAEWEEILNIILGLNSYSNYNSPFS